MFTSSILFAFIEFKGIACLKFFLLTTISQNFNVCLLYLLLLNLLLLNLNLVNLFTKFSFSMFTKF